LVTSFGGGWGEKFTRKLKGYRDREVFARQSAAEPLSAREHVATPGPSDEATSQDVCLTTFKH